MAGQTPSRRQLLQALACASVASTATGFARWSFAFAQTTPQHHHPSTHTASTHTAPLYQPRFFTAPQYATVELLAELILPNTAPPHTTSVHPHAKPDPAHAGATDAGVAEFIDFMVFSDPTLHDPFRNGLLWLNGAATALAGSAPASATAAHPAGFRALSHDQQTALLTRLAFRQNVQPGDQPGQEFFALVRRWTVMGFYTTEIGLRQLDFPGLQFYGESPSVPKDGPLARIVAQADRA